MENRKIKEEIISLACRARAASRKMVQLSSSVKDSAMKRMADEIDRNVDGIIAANKKDLYLAREKGISGAMIDRLTLNPKRIKDMADALRDVANQEDPVGRIEKMWRRPNGLEIGRMRVPIGVIGIIYESRPNVTSDAAGLCLKAGNCCLLRGGSESIQSNLAIGRILEEAAKDEGLPDGVIQVIGITDRQAVTEMIRLYDYIDLIIPRGGEGLIRAVTEGALVPVVAHYKGVCHVYVDRFADMAMAEEICFNAKVQRPGVCNAMETMLVHRDVAGEFLPVIARRFKDAGVEMRGCDETIKFVPEAKQATEEDWFTEYLDLILAIRVVNSMDDAIDHINNYGSHHSDAIVTNEYQMARDFLNRVDSAAVYVNASTRFTDGGEFGLGAEIGISTQKIHARGPMGIDDLTTIKYIILGNGQIRK
ncbi:glutamate-5-semialdehyde dehydrogenase [bacterium]|nr:glutamate-5-semialdehyde dehydrogenase [bacterium]